VVNAEGTTLVDEHGVPFEPRVARVLSQMRMKLQRQFPACRDELLAVDVLEEAGRRLLRRERRLGPIANLHGYAWVTIRSVVTSKLRRGEARIVEHSVRARDLDALVSAHGATRHAGPDLERRVLLRQVLAGLTEDERRVCAMKAAGYTAGEIAGVVGRTITSVDTLYSRAKAKARRLTSSRRPPQVRKF
jgi:RNA polymerase sigma factor (sigma-70 family)